MRMTLNTVLTHNCPKRFNTPTVGFNDSWDLGTSFAGHETDDRFTNCSYCGSINASEFLKYLKEGWTLIPTDKNYKAYLGEPVDPPELVANTVVIDHRDVGKFYFQHLSSDQRHELIELVNERKIKFGYPGYFYIVPYFASRVP